MKNPKTIPEALIALVWINLEGWYTVLRRVLARLLSVLSGLSLFQLLFFLSSFAVLALAFPNWIEYHTKFLVNETINTGSRFKLLFALPGLFGIFAGIIGIPRRREIFYTLFACVFILYVTGFFLPGLIHASFKNTADFQLTPILYGLYGVALLVCAATAGRALAKPLIIPKETLQYYSRVPEREYYS